MSAPAVTGNNNSMLDMALDDIIDTNKTSRRGARRGPGGAIRNGRRTPTRDTRSRPYGASTPTRGGAPAAISDRIMVSNLAKSVTQDDVRELFAQIGPVKSAQLNYDANGRSKGVATIIFSRAGDAQKAIREYHNRTLDNKPMKIELIVRADAPALTAPRATIASRLGGGGRSGGLAGRRGGDRRRGAGGNRSTHKKTPKTQEELDAEMEAYMKEEGAAMDVDGSQAATAASSNGINVNLANALM